MKQAVKQVLKQARSVEPQGPLPDEVAAVDRAILTRRSVRAFLDTPVPRETVEDILGVASRAPSGTIPSLGASTC